MPIPKVKEELVEKLAEVTESDSYENWTRQREEKYILLIPEERKEEILERLAAFVRSEEERVLCFKDVAVISASQVVGFRLL